MNKQLYLLSDGTEVFEARMLTYDEVLKLQNEANDHTDGNLNWYGPFDVKDPATMRIVHVNVQETSIH